MSKGSGQCAATGEPIAPGSVFVAALVELPASQPSGTEAGGSGEGLQRLDFSLSAWEAGARPAAPAQLFGFWKTVYQPTIKSKQPLLDDESLLEVFESTSEATDAKQVRFRYLLTLVLIRRRLLRVVATKTREGAKVMHVLRRGEPDAVPMEVVDPGMDDLSVADAMETLAPLIDPDSQGPASDSAGASSGSQIESKS